MTNPTKYLILLWTAAATLTSCSDEKGDNEILPDSPYLQEISVVRASRAVGDADGDGDADADNPGKLPYDGETIIDTEFIPDVSILYVSQRTRSQNPFEGSNKIYQYKFFENQYATWEEGFNFKPADADYDPKIEVNPNALNWDDVSKKGSVGNGFALYAMYYPNQQLGRRYVAEDQSELDSLKASDIMAAYHSTSALYSRVRFKLHHLMVYFKINLYVPVFSETWKTEDGDKPKNQGFSGYTAESLIDSWIMNAVPKFTVDWAASISSEASPAVNLPDSYTKEDYRNIRMYSHAHGGNDYVVPDETQSRSDGDGGEGDGNGDGNGDDDTGDDDTGSTIRPVKKTRIDISQFLPADMIGIQPMDPDADGKIYDDVFMYSFSVIVPAQYSDFTSQNPGFLKFAFKRPSTKTDKNYYFSSGFSSNSSTSVLEPNRGTLQVLNLYLPRKGDEVILIGAEIEDWVDMETDMNLPQQDKSEDLTNPGS